MRSSRRWVTANMSNQQECISIKTFYFHNLSLKIIHAHSTFVNTHNTCENIYSCICYITYTRKNIYSCICYIFRKIKAYLHSIINF